MLHRKVKPVQKLALLMQVLMLVPQKEKPVL